MKPKRHVCTCLTPATHWCPKTGKQYCQQHAERYASLFGEESLKLFPADKPKPAIKESSELNDRIKRLEDAGDALKASHYFGGWADAVNKWVKIREEQP